MQAFSAFFMKFCLALNSYDKSQFAVMYKIRYGK